MIDLSHGAYVAARNASTTTYRYQVVKRWAEKSLPCPVCGKKVRRSKTFEATVNPFNRNPDGTPRSPHEVGQALNEEVTAWKQKPETHQKCAS